jgi:membrane protein DedA with SNARE-associated domain
MTLWLLKGGLDIMTLEQYISTYGYFALFIGAVMEGESFVLVAGFLAHQGYLQLPWVMVVAGTGAFTGDQIFFHLGRRGGLAFVRKPHWVRRAAKVRQLLERYQNWIVIGFRFLIGLRIATPIIIGMAGYSALRFLILNAIGATIWAVVIGFVGYLFGNLVTPYIAQAREYQWWIILGILSFWSLMWLLHHFLTKHEIKSQTIDQINQNQTEESP